MCEVIFDSTLLCMLTGIAILLAVPDISAFSTPMSLVSAAINSAIGDFSIVLLPLVILAFAYATIICWYFYGRECASLYFPIIKKLYPYIFISFVLSSRLISSEFLLYVIDILLLFMSVMTLSAIIKKTPRISEICRLSRKKNPE